MSKDDKDIPVLNLFPNEYRTYQRKDYGFIVLIFLALSTILLFVMGYLILSQTNTGGDFKNRAGSFLVILAVVLMVVTILWGIRKRIFAFILSFVLLISLYIVEGQILYALGLISQPFSWGVVTLLVISAFSYWLGTKIEWDDAPKVILLMIVAYLLNYSGWLAGANELLSFLSLSKILHLYSGVILI